MDHASIPTHIAIIMDGNRRWAKEHKLEIMMGHFKGAERIETIVEYASKKKIPYMTFWAFSTENWKRGGEVAVLLEVFRNVLKGPMVPRLIKNGVKLNIIGDYASFPEDIVQGTKKVIMDSKNNTRIIANIALNYGGKQDILRAVNKILKEEKSEIDEKRFSMYLDLQDQPDPDMIIRTGGEQRLSGFLPWQSGYSELYFTNTYWPDFEEKEFDKALEEFARRDRRFGK